MTVLRHQHLIVHVLPQRLETSLLVVFYLLQAEETDEDDGLQEWEQKGGTRVQQILSDADVLIKSNAARLLWPNVVRVQNFGLGFRV